MKKQEEILADPVEKLKLLLEQGEFELLEEKTEGRISYRLIYLMNDAVESFLVLKNCRMTGEYLADYEGKIETELREYKKENVKSETFIPFECSGDDLCGARIAGGSFLRQFALHSQYHAAGVFGTHTVCECCSEVIHLAAFVTAGVD